MGSNLAKADVFALNLADKEIVNVIPLDLLCDVSSLNVAFFEDIFSMCDSKEFLNDNFIIVDGIGACVTKEMVEFCLFALEKHHLFSSSTHLALRAFYGMFDVLLVFHFKDLNGGVAIFNDGVNVKPYQLPKSKNNPFKISFEDFELSYLGASDTIPFARDISITRIFNINGYDSLIEILDRLDFFSSKTYLLKEDEPLFIKAEFGSGNKFDFHLNKRGLGILAEHLKSNGSL